LGRCAALPKLKLGLGAHWPEVAGLEMLRELEWFELGGNLLVLPPGLVWPGARRAKLACAPLAARSVRYNTGPFHRACSERLQKPGIEHTVTAAPGVDHNSMALLAMPSSRRSEGKRPAVSPAARTEIGYELNLAWKPNDGHLEFFDKSGELARIRREREK
jgi:hypothetical protein